MPDPARTQDKGILRDLEKINPLHEKDLRQLVGGILDGVSRNIGLAARGCGPCIGGEFRICHDYLYGLRGQTQSLSGNLGKDGGRTLPDISATGVKVQ